MKRSGPSGSQKGFSLIESLLALFILSFVVIAIISTLGAGAKASLIGNEQATAESLARSQLEIIKNAAFDPSHGYEAIVPPPSWSIATEYAAAPGSTMDHLQKATVVVSHSGKPILSMSAYKAFKGD